MYVNVLLPKSCCRGGCGLGPAHCISLLCLLWLLRLLWLWLWLLLPSLPSLGGLCFIPINLLVVVLHCFDLGLSSLIDSAIMNGVNH